MFTDRFDYMYMELFISGVSENMNFKQENY